MTQKDLPDSEDWTVSKDVQILHRALSEDLGHVTPSSQGRIVVALCGLPGTGKSHFAAELSRRFPCLVLGSDRLRKTLVAEPKYTRGEHARVFSAAHALLESLLHEGYPVVFDATNLTERAREPLREIAGKAGATLVLVQFDAPPDLVRQRLARRSRGLASDSYSDADWRIYCRLYPGQERVVDPHFSVDSSLNIEPVVEEVAALLEQVTSNLTALGEGPHHEA